MHTNDIAVFECDILSVAKKKGELVMDSSGYREIVVGAFNCDNAHGQHYKMTEHLKDMFGEGGVLHRRWSKGNLKGEWGHPEMMPGENVHSFVNRFKRVTEKNISHHFKRLRLAPGKDNAGNDIILVYSTLKESGPYAQCMADALANCEENANFSIRSTSNRKVINGQLVKFITAIFTWDYVNEPGIEIANKYDTPTMESLFSQEFTENDLNKAEEVFNHLSSVVGIESSETMSYAMIRDANGWNKVDVIDLRSPLNWGR